MSPRVGVGRYLLASWGARGLTRVFTSTGAPCLYDNSPAMEAAPTEVLKVAPISLMLSK